MRKYLLTWYGITDLRASLGLTPSEGPVLSAIKHGNYTDVFILAYTNKDKIYENEIANEKQDKPLSKFSKWKESILSKIRFGKTNFNSDMKTIDKYSNTKKGHLHYENWLQNKIKSLNKEVELTLFYIKLDKLNDANGIYKAVSKSLNIVSAENTEKEVTVFLSPGTPVMAFNWAYAALMNPGLQIKVIASSDSRKPPEEITLPFKLLDVGKIEKKKPNHSNPQFDVTFHLFGEQRMPSMLGIKQFNSKIHIFVNSAKYPADMMKSLIGDSEFQELRVNPFDPKNVEASILQVVSNLHNAESIGLNLTGGTKLMYAGALQAAKKLNAIPFYFETLNHKLIYLDSFEFAEVKDIENVELFFQTNSPDFTISDKGIWDDQPDRNNSQRILLTNKLWENKSRISKLYKELSKLTDEPGIDFNIKSKNIKARLYNRSNAEIQIYNDTFKFSNWPDFAQYLCGGWFEEYTYLQIKLLYDKGIIKDLRINMEISLKEKLHEEKKGSNIDWQDQLNQIYGESYQELDVVFTDGKRLYIVECKAGRIKSEDIMKLQNNIRFFGGNDGKSFLVSCFEPDNSVVKKKIEKARNVELVNGSNVYNIIKKLLT
jgi:hypothetical protein